MKPSSWHKWTTEQNLSFLCMAPLSKLVFRNEEWKQEGFINIKSNTCMTFPGEKDFNAGHWLAGQDNICRFEETALTCGCTGFQCHLWFMTTFTDVRIYPPYKPVPTKSQRSTASTLMVRSTSRLTESTLLEECTSPSALSWAWEPHSPGHNNWVALSSHLKDPCSFSRACYSET